MHNCMKRISSMFKSKLAEPEAVEDIVKVLIVDPELPLVGVSSYIENDIGIARKKAQRFTPSGHHAKIFLNKELVDVIKK